MSCKYCDDTGLIRDMPCPNPDCVVGKAFKTQLIKYQEKTSEAVIVADNPDNKPTLSESDQERMIDAVHEIKELVTESKENKNAFDLLRYRFKDNGIVLFIYGPKENQDKVVERLEQVVNKYKKKKIFSLDEFSSKPKKTIPLPIDKGFSFKKLLKK